MVRLDGLSSLCYIDLIVEKGEAVMKVDTYEGVVENGQIRLPPNVSLPEKAKVYIVVPSIETRHGGYIRSPRLAHPEQAADFKKEIIEGE